MEGLRHRQAGVLKKSDKEDTPSISSAQPLTNSKYGTGHLLSLVLFVGALTYAVYVSDQYLPTPKSAKAPLNEFSGMRARKHLNAITKLGPRPAGSYENDVLAVDYITAEIEKIKAKVNSNYDFEMQIQTPSGSFAFIRELINFGMTNAYANITNILVKLSPRGAKKNINVLVNAHFDSVPKTEGASDDAVSCAVMLEVLRCLAQSNTLNKYGVIMLFNGAEEMGLLASHGFVAHHPWVKDIKMVVNLEAAGSGGREALFQTGPGHPWLLETYARSAKYPFTTVVAQELFQAGIVPSDTDFHVFRKYGGLHGLDIAFVKNGYVYHTRYDDAKSIPDGSIQRAGDNVLGIVNGIANSPYLEDPGEYKHGDSVFFDFLGIFLVHYPKRLHVIMNTVTCVSVLVYVTWKLIFSKFSSKKVHVGVRYTEEDASILSVLLSIVVIAISIAASLASAVGVAYLILKTGHTMSWYSMPIFGWMLYGFPALFGVLLAHYVGGLVMGKLCVVNIKSFRYGHMVLYSMVLLLVNQKEVLSSYLLWIWLAFPFLFTSLPADHITFLPGMKHHGILLLHLVGSLVPSLLSISSFQTLTMFFAPLFGRGGTVIPSDVVFALTVAVGVSFIPVLLIPLYHNSANKSRLLFFCFIAALLPFLYTLTGRAFPYSRSNPITPKRFIVQHIWRNFHQSNGSIRKEDSGLWFVPLDYRDMDDIIKIPYFSKTQLVECEGAYCGMPYLYALRKLVPNIWYLHADKPEGIKKPLSIDIFKKQLTYDGKRVKFEFSVQDITSNTHLYIRPKQGAQLADWSFYKSANGFIYSTPDQTGSMAYVVYFARGYGSTGPLSFWVEFKMEDGADITGEVAEIGIARHNLQSTSKILKEAAKALPDWVVDQSWTNNYDSFVLA